MANSEFTLTKAILWMNNPGYRALNAAESNQVATVGGSTNRIAFGLSGSGPHLIVPPDEIAAGAAPGTQRAADQLSKDLPGQPGAPLGLRTVGQRRDEKCAEMLGERTSTVH